MFWSNKRRKINWLETHYNPNFKNSQLTIKTRALEFFYWNPMASTTQNSSLKMPIPNLTMKRKLNKTDEMHPKSPDNTLTLMLIFRVGSYFTEMNLLFQKNKLIEVVTQIRKYRVRKKKNCLIVLRVHRCGYL